MKNNKLKFGKKLVVFKEFDSFDEHLKRMRKYDAITHLIVKDIDYNELGDIVEERSWRYDDGGRLVKYQIKISDGQYTSVYWEKYTYDESAVHIKNSNGGKGSIIHRIEKLIDLLDEDIYDILERDMLEEYLGEEGKKRTAEYILIDDDDIYDATDHYVFEEYMKY